MPKGKFRELKFRLNSRKTVERKVWIIKMSKKYWNNVKTSRQ